MSLTNQLEELTNQAFSNMPEHLAQGLKAGIQEVRTSQLKQNALKVGDKIKNLSLLNIYGEQISLKSLITKDYLLLNFFRGSWCPFCSMELREYERLKEKFLKSNIDIVAISPEVAKYSKKTKEDNFLSFEILSDENSKVMKEFGIVFTLSNEVKKIYEDFKIDLKEQNGNITYKMPVPATYVVDKNFNIVFAHFEEDYTTRCEPKDVLEFIESLKEGI